MPKAAIIHGTKGSPAGNWFPWFAAELRARGFEVAVPQMPTPERQSLDAWFKEFREQCGDLDQESLLVGHSLGAVFAARLLEQLRRPIARAVFVCPFLGMLGIPEYDQLNASFLGAAFDWETIRANAAAVHVLCGSDDPYVPLEQPVAFAKHLGIAAMVVDGGKHLNSEAGYSSLPAILTLLR